MALMYDDMNVHWIKFINFLSLYKKAPVTWKIIPLLHGEIIHNSPKIYEESVRAGVWLRGDP